MEVLGVDIGFGFTKATNGAQTLIFKSIFGDAADMQFWIDFGDTTDADYFHVTIDGRPYFIGDLAEQQSTVLNFTLDQEKLITEFVKVLTLTVAGVFLESDATVNVPINIVSGLPIGYFKNNHERFNEILTGHHKVTYHQPDGRRIVKELYINKIRMLPQPLGSLLNLLMNEKGEISNTELTGQKIGVVDIGFRTTDFTVMDRMRYIDRASRTMDTGISKAFSIISNKLREKCGVNVQLYRLYKAVETGKIKMKGHALNFSKIRDQVYTQLASTIANDIDRLWVDDWDLDAIILTGGGCMELARYLQPLISGHVIPIPHGVDARLNNVEGYLKYGRHIWRNNKSEPVALAPAESDTPADKTPPADEPQIDELAAELLEEPEELEDDFDEDTLVEIEELVDENLEEKF